MDKLQGHDEYDDDDNGNENQDDGDDDDNGNENQDDGDDYENYVPTY